MALLEVQNLKVRYGKVPVVRGISLRVEQGELVALVGANGAGKTSTLRAISGLVRPSEGAVYFDGSHIDGLDAHQIARLGLLHVAEGRRLFAKMSVLENLELGAFRVNSRSTFESLIEPVFRLFPVLSQRRHQRAGTLSGGEQQMLAVARALMGHPRLLMLDEPSQGLAPLVVRRIFEVVRQIRDEGTTVLLVEQNVQHALELADRAYVIENGRVVMEGSGPALLHHEHLRAAYLGL